MRGKGPEDRSLDPLYTPVIGPALGAAITLFGMTQRLGNVDGCDVPADPRAGEPIRVAVRVMEQPDE